MIWVETAVTGAVMESGMDPVVRHGMQARYELEPVLPSHVIAEMRGGMESGIKSYKRAYTRHA